MRTKSVTKTRHRESAEKAAIREASDEFDELLQASDILDEDEYAMCLEDDED